MDALILTVTTVTLGPKNVSTFSGQKIFEKSWSKIRRPQWRGGIFVMSI